MSAKEEKLDLVDWIDAVQKKFNKQEGSITHVLKPNLTAMEVQELLNHVQSGSFSSGLSHWLQKAIHGDSESSDMAMSMAFGIVGSGPQVSEVEALQGSNNFLLQMVEELRRENERLVNELKARELLDKVSPKK